jgi:hypothetical protein
MPAEITYEGDAAVRSRHRRRGRGRKRHFSAKTRVASGFSKPRWRRELKLGPGDINPLDPIEEPESCDDPRALRPGFRQPICGAHYVEPIGE